MSQPQQGKNRAVMAGSSFPWHPLLNHRHRPCSSAHPWKMEHSKAGFKEGGKKMHCYWATTFLRQASLSLFSSLSTSPSYFSFSLPYKREQCSCTVWHPDCLRSTDLPKELRQVHCVLGLSQCSSEESPLSISIPPFQKCYGRNRHQSEAGPWNFQRSIKPLQKRLWLLDLMSLQYSIQKTADTGTRCMKIKQLPSTLIIF